MKIIRCDFVEGMGFNVDNGAYRDYFNANKDRFPTSARNFAGAPWHYDFSDPRCPHGARCASLKFETPVEEIGAGHYRGGEIRVRLLSPTLTGYLILTYVRVRSHLFELYSPMPEDETSSYDDLIIDEVRLTENGKVIHEIQFASGQWLIECGDIVAEWKPVSAEARSPDVQTH